MLHLLKLLVQLENKKGKPVLLAFLLGQRDRPPRPARCSKQPNVLPRMLFGLLGLGLFV